MGMCTETSKSTSRVVMFSAEKKETALGKLVALYVPQCQRHSYCLATQQVSCVLKSLCTGDREERQRRGNNEAEMLLYYSNQQQSVRKLAHQVPYKCRMQHKKKPVYSKDAPDRNKCS